MKRLFAICIMICIVISAVSFCVCCEETDTENGFDEAYGLLKALDLIDGGYISSDDRYVTKALMADYIARALKISQDDTLTAFADTEEYDGVNALVSVGYIEGRLDENFFPRDYAKYTDTVKIILKALGYKEVIDDALSDAELISMAKRMKLLKGYDGSINISYKNMLVLIYNMLVFEPDKISGIKQSPLYVNEPLVKTLYGVYIKEDTVTANEYLSLYENILPAGEGEIRLGETEYIGSSVLENEMIGKTVKAYIREVQGFKDAVIFAIQNKKEECYELLGKDILSCDGKMLSYSLNGNRKHIIKLNNPLLVYNRYTDFSAGASIIKELMESAAKREGANLRIIKNEGIDRTVIILDIPEIANVVSVDRFNSKIYVKQLINDEVVEIPYSESFTDNLPGNTRYVSLTDEQSLNKVNIESVSIGDVFSVIKSQDNSVFISVHLTRRVSGKISNISDSGDLLSVIIDGKEYSVEYAYGLKENIYLGDNASFILDTYGSIAGTKGTSVNGNPIFGYIYKVTTSKPRDGVSVKIYNEYDEDTELFFAKKVKYDGTYLSDEKINDILENTFEPVALIYKLNSKGEINFADTPGSNNSPDDCFRLVGAKSGVRRFDKDSNLAYDIGYRHLAATDEDVNVDSANSFGFYLSKETKIIEETSAKTGSKTFNVVSTDDLRDASDFEMNLYKYKDDSPFIEYIVSYGFMRGGGIFEKNFPAMVNKVKKGVNSQEEVCGVIECIWGRTTYWIQDIYLEEYVDLYINAAHIRIKSTDIGKYIGSGDLLKFNYIFDLTGKVNRLCSEIAVVYDYSEDKLEWCWGISDTKNGAYYDTELSSFEEYEAYMASDETKKKYSYTYESRNINDMGSKGRSTFGEIVDAYTFNSAFHVIKGAAVGSDIISEHIIDKSKVKPVFFDESRKDTKAYHGSINDIRHADKEKGINGDKYFTYRFGWTYGAVIYVYKQDVIT